MMMMETEGKRRKGKGRAVNGSEEEKRRERKEEEEEEEKKTRRCQKSKGGVYGEEWNREE
ncbi:hypothetical protein PRIPAC_92176 [Pristionchus pacificus]|nr:hypothetical protein PRIPAC_92176 [Pristionchus pacificus]|eukprot:PDM68193.1 hypothetical protein PRIPAC_46237 [Pristionchus pacificus]